MTGSSQFHFPGLQSDAKARNLVFVFIYWAVYSDTFQLKHNCLAESSEAVGESILS